MTTNEPEIMTEIMYHPVGCLDDWEDEVDIEPTFIGRKRDLEILNNALKGPYRMFGIFGIRSVGKSRLVKELLRQYISVNVKKGSGWKTSIIRSDLAYQTDISAVYANLCTSVGVRHDSSKAGNESWVLQIIRHIKNQPKQNFIFVFDNVEMAEDDDRLRDSLASLFLELTLDCLHVKLFITSTTKFMPSQLQKVCFCHELLPLLPFESAELFRVIAPEVYLGDYETTIVKLSEGLPLLISMIANELADDDGLITPKDMVELLATSRLKCLSRRDFYAEEDCIAEVYQKFIERLHTVYQSRLAALGYIPGSFDVREAKGVLGFASDAEVEDKALFPIRRHYMLNYDQETRRFDIQGILRECLEVFFTIQYITDVRKKYCETFSTVMQEISTKLGTAEYAKALSQFSLEKPNLQKLLTEVYYTTEDTYRFFITMATSCTELIEQFMLKDSDTFYQGCYIMADKYGNSTDKAMVSVAVGSMWTNAKDDLQKGAENYKVALAILVNNGNRLQLATIYQRLGWNLHRQGRNVEAIGYFKKSLNISKLGGGPELQRLERQSMNSLGITSVIVGNFKEAKKYHFASLKRARKTLKHDHPAIGAILNNIGEYYEFKGDSENALKYYLEGLGIKKKSKGPQSSILISISSVANEYRARRKYADAHALLDESLETLRKQEIPMKSVMALTLDTKGKVLMDEGRYKEALEMFERAVEIREDISPDDIVYFESVTHVVVAKQHLARYKSCIKTGQKTVAMKDKAIMAMPHNSVIAECYTSLAEAYRSIGHYKKYQETMEQLESELMRLERVLMAAGNEIKMDEIRKQLGDVRNQLQTITVNYFNLK